MASFDHILETYVGACGWYQKLLIFLISTSSIFSSMNTIEVIFAVGEMDHHCKVPQPNEGPLANLSTEEWLNMTVPWIYKDGHWGRDSCHMYNVTSYIGDTISDFTSPPVPLNGLITDCLSYEYDTSLFRSTIVNEFDIVCERSYYISFIKSFSVAAKCLGVVFGGFFADRFGRKRTMIGSFVFMMIGRLLVTCSQSVPIYILGVIVTACFQMFYYVAAFTLCLEIISPSWRAVVGAIPCGLWAIGYIVAAGVAYLCRDRLTLHIAITVPIFIYIPVVWLAPESPRWLLARGRKKKATTILRHLAKRNGINWPSDVKFDEIDSEISDQQSLQLGQIVKQMCTSKVLVFRIVIAVFAWFTANAAYYGLTLNIQSLAGDIYSNLAVAGALEFLGYSLGFVLYDSRLGRRITTSVLFILSGVFLLLVLAVPEDKKIYATALALCGRTCSAASFMIMYVWTAELFPTAIRSTSLSLASASGKIGAILSPFLTELGAVLWFLPMVLLGALSILSGLLLLTFPETKGAELPNTVEDMLHSKKLFKDSQKFGKYAECETERAAI